MSILLQILIVVTLIYGFLSLVVWLLMTNNILVWRSGNYSISFGVVEGKQHQKELNNPKIRYWRCEHPKFNDESWVVRCSMPWTKSIHSDDNSNPVCSRH
jgi:hypothetical protein